MYVYVFGNNYMAALVVGLIWGEFVINPRKRSERSTAAGVKIQKHPTPDANYFLQNYSFQLPKSATGVAIGDPRVTVFDFPGEMDSLSDFFGLSQLNIWSFW